MKKRRVCLGFDLKHISAGQGCGVGFSPILAFIVVSFVLFLFVFSLFFFSLSVRMPLWATLTEMLQRRGRASAPAHPPCSMGKAPASPRHAAAAAFAGLMNNACVEWLGSSGAPSLQRVGIGCYCRLGFFLFLLFSCHLGSGGEW